MNNPAPVYINGLGNVSPQKTMDNSVFLNEPERRQTNRLACIEPVYRDFISPDILRRMGRLIKMGVASSKICLQNAVCGIPDAIITGTGLGCMEDTEKFLATLVRNKEELLTPTSFIQSTHNTVSAQIALLLKCHNYNFTYVHRGWSFESALTDAMMQIRNGRAATVLAGGMDELTNSSFEIMRRLGLWRRKAVDTSELFGQPSKGSIAGEGSAFFLLSSANSEHTYAKLTDLHLFRRKHSEGSLSEELAAFLQRSALNFGDIDLVISGLNGDASSDKIYKEITGIPGAAGIGAWKHLSGEYQTSSAFGLWMAAMAMKFQRLPEAAVIRSPYPGPLKTILLYNHYLDLNHSFILLQKP